MPVEPISIRTAVASEKATLKQLIRTGRLNPLGFDWSRFLVAVSASGEIVGCIQCKRHRGDVMELASLYVVPAWRQQGVAARLIRELLRMVTQPLWLTCRSRLTDFYARFGFHVVQDTTSMPVYFRYASRVFKVIRRFFPGDDALAVMYLEARIVPVI